MNLGRRISPVFPLLFLAGSAFAQIKHYGPDSLANAATPNIQQAVRIQTPVATYSGGYLIDVDNDWRYISDALFCRGCTSPMTINVRPGATNVKFYGSGSGGGFYVSDGNFNSWFSTPSDVTIPVSTGTIRIRAVGSVGLLVVVVKNVEYDWQAPSVGRIVFDADSYLDSERRLQISKAIGVAEPHHAEDTSDSRPVYRVTGRIVDASNGTPIPNAKAYFRLLDPPDTSGPVAFKGYGNAPNVDKSPDVGIRKDATFASSSSVGLSSDANGAFGLELVGTNQFAGDNYQIEASVSSTFDCGAVQCVKSPVFTAWKRLHVERHEMFRAGAFITEIARAGDGTVTVSDPSAFKSGPVEVRLVHAPSILSTEKSFYFEDAIVDGVQTVTTKQGSKIATRYVATLKRRTPSGGLDPYALLNDYGPDLGVKHAYLSDGVGVLQPPHTTFRIDMSLTSSVFDDAYTEVREAPNGYIEVPHHEFGFDIETIMFARKWRRHFDGVKPTPNHVFLLGADKIAVVNKDTVPESCSTVDRLGGTNADSLFSYVYVGEIEKQTADGPPENASSLNVRKLAGYTSRGRTWNEKEQVHGSADHRGNQRA